VYFSKIDPKGSIPKSVAAGKMKENGLRVANLKKFLKK
jgi:hypothetical protein